MKILFLTVTVLNFMIYFPYNGSQETYNQSNQHFSANSALSSSDSHTASQISSILRTNGNAAPTEDANSYSGSTDRVTRLSGFLSERNHSKTLQGSMNNFFPFGDDAPHNSSASQTLASFAYRKGTVDNSTQTGAPISNTSLSSATIQGLSAVSTTTLSFAPNSRITRGRVVLSRENSISAPVSMTMHQYKSDSTVVPQFQINSKAIQSPEPFFPSTGSSKPFFASNPAAYIQNPKNDFAAPKEGNTITITNADHLLGTDSTTQKKEAEPDNIFFINTIALMAERNTEKNDATDILEGYATPLDIPGLEDDSLIITDATYLERYSKPVSNAPDLPKKDNSVVIDVTNMRNNGRATVNAQIPGISSAKKSNDFAFVPTLSTYDKAETKPITIATDNIDEAMTNINPITTTNYFLNDRIHEKSNKVVSASTNTKTMTDVAKNAMQVGDLNIPQTNRIISTKHYANSNFVDLSRHDGTLLKSDASTVIKSAVPFDHPQARNPVKKTSLANIIMPKTFHNKAVPAALTLPVSTVSEGDVDIMFYIPRYESENSFVEDITLNYEEGSPKKVDIMAEEEDRLQEKSAGHYNYITSPASENVPRDRYLAAKYYSISPDVYDSSRLRGTIKTMADQAGFGNPAPSYMAKVSKPLLTKLTPKFQGKMTVRNSNRGTDHGAFFGGDNLYLDIKGNIPKGYTVTSERESTFTIPDFRIPVRDNINPALKRTVLLGKETFRKNHASNTDKQIDLGTKKDQSATGSIINSQAGIIPVTSFTPISSEDMEDYSRISKTGTPLSLRYTNTLVDDSFILGPGSIQAKENKLDDMNFFTVGPDESGSEYISSKHAFKLEDEDNSPINKMTPFTQRPHGFISHIPFSNAEVTRRLLHRITHPEVETKEKYQIIPLKEENSDSDIITATFKGYPRNVDSQHQRIMTVFPIDGGEISSSEFVEASVGQDTLSTDDIIIIFPEVYDLGNKEIKHPFGADTEIIVFMGESRTLRAEPIDHAVITTPIKSQEHFYRKGITFNAYNTTAPKLADTIMSEKSKINGDKMDSAEITLSENHINPLTQKNAPQDDNSYANDVTNNAIDTGSVASFYPVNATKMTPSATITISPNARIFASKKSDENGGSVVPEEDGNLSMNLNYPLIHNLKRPRAPVGLLENDDSLSDTSVTSEVSRPLVEHSADIDQNWEITKVQSVLQPFSMVSSVLLEDPTIFSKNSINVATEKAATENGGINDKIVTMGFSPKLALQSRINRKGEKNKTPDYDVSHYINEAIIPTTEEITPPDTQANTFLSKDISEANIPVNLKEVNTVKVNPFILKPDVTSAEWKAPGTSKEAFYPDSTMNTTKLTIAGTKGSFFLDNENIERSITNSYNNLSLKSNLPYTDVTKISNSELDPVHIMGEDNIKMTDDSNIANANNNIILPNHKRMEYSLIPEPELMTAKGASSMFTDDSIDSVVIMTPTENKNQFNKKGISFATYNNTASDGAKATVSARLDANKDKKNWADVASSQNSIIYFNVIPDDDHAFISKSTEEANNRNSIFSSPINKAASTVADPPALSNGGSYEGGDSFLPGENYVRSRGVPSLSASAMLIPIAITENSETSDLMRYDSLSESSLAGSEVLEIITEYADTITGGDVPEGQIITQTDIQSYPLAKNAPSTGLTTFTENPTEGEVDLVFSLNRDTPDNYKTKTDKIYPKPQRAMMKAFYPREDSQNTIFRKRKIANLSDQENPTPKFLSHFTDVPVLIPTMEKSYPSATGPNTLSKSDNNMREKVHFSEAGNSFSKDASTLKDDPFPVKFDASLAKPQAPSNLKGFFSDDSTLTLPEAFRPNDQSFASLDKVSSTGGSFTNTETGSYGLPWKSTLPPSDFTTSMSTPKYSERVPVTTMEIDTTTRIDNNVPPEKSMIPFDQFILLLSAIASEKDKASTFNENIFGPKNFREREIDSEYERIFFIEDNSERVGDIYSADKFISAYADSIIITFDDSGSDYISNKDAFESEKKASNSFTKMNTFTYAPKTDGSFVPYNTAAASENLSKAKLSGFKAKENYQTIIPRKEYKNFEMEATAPKDSTALVNSKARGSTTYFLIDASENFPPRFTDKTSVGKSATNGDDVTIIPYEGLDFGNKISKYSFVPDTEPTAESRMFTRDATNHAVKNGGHLFRKNISPITYNVFIPTIADTTTSTTSEFAKDETGVAVVSDSKFSTFPSTQLSDDSISTVAESTQAAVNTALTSFSPLKKMSTITSNAPAISTKDKNYFGHSSLPLSQNVMSLRLPPMGQPGTLFLIADAPTKETVAHRLGKDTSLYHPPMSILAASEPVFTYSAYFNEGVVPEGQNAKSQTAPRALPLIYTVLQTDSSGFSDKITDVVKLNTSATTARGDSIYGIDVSGGLNSEPKKTTKFSTLLPDKYNIPNFYHTREITKASAVKDTATESEVNHLTAIIPEDGSVIQTERNPLRDANIKPFLVNKNVIADGKSINRDYDNVPIAIYSSFPILKGSLPAEYVWQEANSMAEYSNLPMRAITIIPTDEKSSPHTEIISLVKGNSQLKFDAANLRAANNEFQALENTNITHKSIVEKEKILPKLQEISIVPQSNKEAGEVTLFMAGIPRSQMKRLLHSIFLGNLQTRRQI